MLVGAVANAGGGSYTPGSQFYGTPGTYTFVVPGGVSSVTAYAVGGGGSSNLVSAGGGGGGAGGQKTFTVTAGQNITVVVGQGATAPLVANRSGSNGGTSSFSTLSAGGGSTPGYTAGYTVGGAGGTISGHDVELIS